LMSACKFTKVALSTSAIAMLASADSQYIGELDGPVTLEESHTPEQMKLLDMQIWESEQKL